MFKVNCPESDFIDASNKRNSLHVRIIFNIKWLSASVEKNEILIRLRYLKASTL